MTVWIYALVDPRSSKVFYVGKTSTTVAQRLRSHISEARSGVGQCSSAPTILEIIATGNRPIASVLEITDWRDWREAERRWIKHYVSVGTICNRTTGGEAAGNAWRGKRQSAEHADKKRRSMEKHRQQASVEQAERWQDQEYRDRVTASMTGRKRSDEHRKNVGKASVKAWADPDIRAKRVASLADAMAKPEYHAKLRAAAKAKWADPVWRASMVAARAAARAERVS